MIRGYGTAAARQLERGGLGSTGIDVAVAVQELISGIEGRLTYE
jgi:hypothetical protein